MFRTRSNEKETHLKSTTKALPDVLGLLEAAIMAATTSSIVGSGMPASSSDATVPKMLVLTNCERAGPRCQASWNLLLDGASRVRETRGVPHEWVNDAAQPGGGGGDRQVAFFTSADGRGCVLDIDPKGHPVKYERAHEA